MATQIQEAVGMEAHPAADLFPMMSDAELHALAEDIKANGQVHPIVLDTEERVLDGRNRLAACELAGVEPQFVTEETEDPVALVVSLNVKRRNLNKGQTAIAAAEASTFRHQGVRALADMFGVGKDYIAQARALVERDPLAAEAVKNGKPLKDAYEDLQRREGKHRGDASELAKLRADHPDLADAVDQEALSLNEALQEATNRAEEDRKLRYAATTNVLDGLRLLEQPAEPHHLERTAGLLDPKMAADRGETISPERLRAAASFANALADTLERSTDA